MQQWARRKAPPGWDRDVPYDIRERRFQFAVRVIEAARQLPRDTVAKSSSVNW